jgi:hypothetical protein
MQPIKNMVIAADAMEVADSFISGLRSCMSSIGYERSHQEHKQHHKERQAGSRCQGAPELSITQKSVSVEGGQSDGQSESDYGQKNEDMLFCRRIRLFVPPVTPLCRPQPASIIRTGARAYPIILYNPPYLTLFFKTRLRKS